MALHTLRQMTDRQRAQQTALTIIAQTMRTMTQLRLYLSGADKR